ncbi:MAG: hypothetical protein HKN72_05795 [Gemmatimonadetes bacterium]|nr:hypothetical protein [Gemmatimonadota bacterium]
MSDSEGTKELSGIARSVDALFSSPSAGTVPVSRGTAPAADAEPVAAATEDPPHGEVALGGEVDAAAGEPPLEASESGDASYEELYSFDDLSPVQTLDEAVEAYLAGDSDQAAEIERLANEMLEKRELDGVARAVARVAAGAGDPPDPMVVEVARGVATPVVYGRLARQMAAERDEVRRQDNFLACRNLGDPMAMAIRDDLAESTDRSARRVHCDALVAMGRPGRKIIEEMVVDDNRFLVRNAVAILGETGGDNAVELVAGALANPDAKVRREALRSLVKLGDEESGELIVSLRLLEDPDPEVRIAAAVAAGELHVERSLRSLIKLLDETNDPDEAISLIRALGQLGDPGAVTSIEKHAVPKLFYKPRVDVRIAAYRALNEIGTPHARRLLNQAMDDKDADVKASVKDLLGLR